jgi:methyltransferase (TIGR00027 family)
MTGDNRSIMAEFTAMMRAQHYLHDERPLILEDPFAIRLLSSEMAQGARAKGFQVPIQFRVGALVLGRSRFAEDCFEEALNQGVKQYVSLGAGLDTFSLRRSDLVSQIRIYEIDQPTTQQWKQQLLETSGCGIPENLEFVPANLEEETVLQALARSSFNSNEPAFFSWLGTTMYLTHEAVFRSLESFADSLAPGSEIVFDYRVPIEFVSPEDVENAQIGWKAATDMGEPLYASLNPLTLPDEMCEVGFEVVETLTPQQLAERYFSQRNDALHPMTHHYYIHLRTCTPIKG